MGKKHSFGDGKHFTDFVLLRCFIDFQTTLVDSTLVARGSVSFALFPLVFIAGIRRKIENLWQPG
jgi:hypothetical protein